jgi:hypothetical protein
MAKMRTRHGCLAFVASLVTSTLLATAKDASALGPIDLEVGAKAGAGTTPSNTPSGAPNPLGFGLGARAGIAILGLYGGASIVYYFGGSEQPPPLPNAILGGSPPKVSTHSLMYGVEAGYGGKLLELLTLRAQVGIGNFTNTVDVGSASNSNNNLYVEPGVVGLLGLGSFFVGADANVLILPGLKDYTGTTNTDIAFTFHGQVGYKF